MSALSRDIRAACLRILGVDERTGFGADTQSTLQTLSTAFPGRVLEAFEEWAEKHKGNPPCYPISAFLRDAPGILRGEIILKPSDELQFLLTKIRKIAGTDVTFDSSQLAAVDRLLKTYKENDFLLGFRQFYSQLDTENSYQMSRAGRDWAEKGEQFILAFIEARKKQQQNEETARRLTEQGRKEVESVVEEEASDGLSFDDVDNDEEGSN